ncbi:MAG: TIR domain-containing protein [Prevotellaceae bacterium]|nr:TIR domain-containing protein [Prevotellaceae bacterium]
MDSRIYTQIKEAICNHVVDITVERETTPNDIRDAIRWVMRDNPDIFWFACQYRFDKATSSIHFQYIFSIERIKDIQDSIDNVLENDFCFEYVKRRLSQQEQVAYVYKWLVTYCNYNIHSAYNQSIYSVFVRRNSVCTGYAKAAQYLFKLLGIKSSLVFGRLNNDNETGRHCWNIVEVDGQHYHFDACFGDNMLDDIAKRAGIQEQYKIGNMNYNYFCVSTDEILKTRNIENKELLPKCDVSLSTNIIDSLAIIHLKERDSVRGCLLTRIGSSADVYLCSKDKNTVLKIFRPNSKTTSTEEYYYMQQMKGCPHILQSNEQYTDIRNNVIAMEQSTPIVDLLCSHYYELSLKGLIKIAMDVAMAWTECQKRGVLYRDIHICNIYRANDGTFKLGDFGSCTNRFNAKEVVGNQWFMAPETLSSGIFTEGSAVYSISMVVYFILNNLRPAFWKPGYDDCALQKRMDGNELYTPIACGTLPQSVSDEVRIFFKETLVFDPWYRLGNLFGFMLRLQQFIEKLGNSDYVIHYKENSSDFDVYNSELCSTRSFDMYHHSAESNRSCIDHSRYNECVCPPPSPTPSPKRKVVSAPPPSKDGCTSAPTSVYKEDTDCLYEAIYVDAKDVDCSYTEDTNCSPLYEVCEVADDLFVDDVESFARTQGVVNGVEQSENDLLVDDVESFARTQGIVGGVEQSVNDLVVADGIKSFARTQDMVDVIMESPECAVGATIICSPIYSVIKLFKQYLWKKLSIKRKEDEVYCLIFAPAKIRRRSNLYIQIYLSLPEEMSMVILSAKESDKDAERKDSALLQMKLEQGQKVDVDLYVSAENRLIMNAQKSIIWQRPFAKCSFVYFVPENFTAGELICTAKLSINNALIGELGFIARIVDAQGNVNPEFSHRTFKKIFISYAHQDYSTVKSVALAYKAQGVDYFFDRDNLKAGDVYENKIFRYIDTADLFILCWSENAVKSEYVAKEKDRALKRAYPQCDRNPIKIHPINIEPHAELPDDMKQIYHFERI